MKKVISIILAGLMLLGNSMNSYAITNIIFHASPVNNPVWINSSLYRKSHSVIGSTSGAVSGYTVKLNVHYGSGSDSTTDVYLGGKSMTNFADVRFGDSTTTVYPYWVESETDSDVETVWVKLDNIPQGPSAKSLYIYYGNLNSVAVSSIISAFPVGIDARETLSIADTTVDQSTGIRPLDSTPVIKTGTLITDFDYKYIREPGNILYDPTDVGKEYKTWYSGGDNAGNPSWLMGAYSSDMITWTKTGRTETDRGGEDPYVLKLGPNNYVMYHEDELNSKGSRYATSTDGFNFVDQGVITVNGCGGAGCPHIPVSPTIWIENGLYYLIFEDYINQPSSPTALATSTDGVNFTYVARILDHTDPGAKPWEGRAAVPDDVIKIGNTYYMSYHTSASVSGVDTWSGNLAYSTDLLNWTRYASNPVHIPSNGGQTSSTVMFNPNNPNQGLFLTFQPGPQTSEYWRVQFTKNPTLSFKYQGGPSFGVSGGTINMQPDSSRTHSMQIVSGFIPGLANSFAMRSYNKIATNKTSYVGWGFGTTYNQAQVANSLSYGVMGNGYDFFWQNSSGNQVFLGLIAGSFPNVKTNLNITPMTLSNMNNFHTNEFIYKADGHFDYQIDGVSVYTTLPQDTTYLNGDKGFNFSVGNGNVTNAGGLTNLRYWLVRRYIDPEPTNNTWGTEEVWVP